MIRVYVAGKLNGMAVDYNKNLHAMINWREILRRHGYAPYCPCLDLLPGIMFGDYEYEDYFQANQPWIDVSDALFVCPGWEESRGTKREMMRAKDKGVPICFTIAELDAVRERVEGRSDAPLSGLHSEPGVSGHVSSLVVGLGDEFHPGPEHLVE